MSRMISTHVSKYQLIKYVDDFHYTAQGDYEHFAREAIRNLWPRFNGHNMDDPYNISLSEVMSYLSNAYEQGVSEERIIEYVSDDVEEIFSDVDQELTDTVVSYQFYLFCTILYDYLSENECIDEMRHEFIEMVTVYRDRVDVTFY